MEEDENTKSLRNNRMKDLDIKGIDQWEKKWVESESIW